MMYDYFNMMEAFVRVENLHHKEILELDPEGGLIRFVGQRALLLDAVAMGVLRQYLVEKYPSKRVHLPALRQV